MCDMQEKIQVKGFAPIGMLEEWVWDTAMLG